MCIDAWNNDLLKLIGRAFPKLPPLRYGVSLEEIRYRRFRASISRNRYNCRAIVTLCTYVCTRVCARARVCSRYIFHRDAFERWYWHDALVSSYNCTKCGVVPLDNYSSNRLIETFDVLLQSDEFWRLVILFSFRNSHTHTIRRNSFIISVYSLGLINANRRPSVEYLFN